MIKTDKKEAMVLSCGPSIGKFSNEQLRKICKDKFVIAIKLSYDLVPDLVDLHIFNCCNNELRNGVFYDYEATNAKKSLFVCASSTYPPHFRIPPQQRFDHFFRVPHDANFKDYMVFIKDLDRWKLSNKNLQNIRRCGPGIFLESCIWWLEHLKFEKFTTLGVDICTTSGGVHDHFWGNRNFLVPGDNIEWEFEENRKFSKDVNNWFKSMGTRWTIIGDSCLSKEIPRETPDV